MVGLDLAGKTTDRTVMAVASSPAGGRPSFDLVSRTADGHRLPEVSGLADMLSGYSPDLVAIDAPLSLPHQVVCADGACRRCFGEEADGSYTQREADRADHWTEIGRVEKPPMPTVMLGSRARLVGGRSRPEARLLLVLLQKCHSVSGQERRAEHPHREPASAHCPHRQWVANDPVQRRRLVHDMVHADHSRGRYPHEQK